MTVSAIYLDGSQLHNKHSDFLQSKDRVAQLRRSLRNNLEYKQVLVTSWLKSELINKGVLPLDSSVEVINPYGPTAGAIASALLAYDSLDSQSNLLLIPTNSFVKTNLLENFVQKMISSKSLAGVLLVKSENPHFSYVRMFENRIIEFVEKKVVGNLATTGIFYFRNKDDLLNCGRWAFVNNQVTENQYYVAPSLNQILTSGGLVDYEILNSNDYEHLIWNINGGKYS